MLVFLQILYAVFAWSLIVLPVPLSFLITFIFQNRLNEQVPQKGKSNSRHKQQVGLFFQDNFLTSKACNSGDSRVVILSWPSE